MATQKKPASKAPQKKSTTNTMRKKSTLSSAQKKPTAKATRTKNSFSDEKREMAMRDRNLTNRRERQVLTDAKNSASKGESARTWRRGVGQSNRSGNTRALFRDDKRGGKALRPDAPAWTPSGKTKTQIMSSRAERGRTDYRGLAQGRRVVGK